MNTKNISIAILAIALIAMGAYAFSTNRVVAPSNEAVIEENSTGTGRAAMETEEDGGPTFKVVTLTDNGFSPTSITIARGETIRFVNDSSRNMWVGADEHPTHTEYDGTSTREHCANGMNTGASFDQCTAVAKGVSWDYTFEKSGTFGYHNHVGASNTGTIVVQ
jgi:plastocyanin